MADELSSEEVDGVLHREFVGRIACEADGRTHVMPVNYAYDGVAVYSRLEEGTPLHMLRQNPDVCFEVDQADDAANGQRVMARGRFEELEGDRATHGRRMLTERLLPRVAKQSGASTRGLAPESRGADAAGREAVLYRIVLGDRSGRLGQR